MFAVLRLLCSILMFAASAAATEPYVIVLGVAQDAGIPQMGCDSRFCLRAWRDPSLRQTVSSIAIVDRDTKQRWIFDATPDLPEQFQLLKDSTGDKSNALAGIFLTHAHIGHYTGLMYLGREAMNANGIRTYAMPRMKQMLETNAPWSQLVDLKNIHIQPLFNKTAVKLTETITVTPFLVPHRGEFSETVGFSIASKAKTLIFIPDIDKWQKWGTSLPELVRSSDYLLLDGTFYADGEIARPMNEVPHPFVFETMELLKDLSPNDRSKVCFIHFNHSNPLIQGDRKKISDLRKKGFRLAFKGQKFIL